MQFKATIAGAVTAAALLASAGGAAAGDPPNFDFNGYAQLPAAVGGPLTVRSVLTNNGVVPTPIPLDFTLNQYTLVLTAVLTADDGTTQSYGTVGFSIYGDPIGGGTAADYGNPATFTDGAVVYSANLSYLERVRFTATLGSFFGPLLPAAGDLFGGWSRTVTGIPAGYQENWDGLIDPGSVSVESETWQGVKSLYR